MENNHIYNLIDKFEKTLNQNEDIIKSISELFLIFENLNTNILTIDNNLIQLYELDKIDYINKNIKEFIFNLEIIRNKSSEFLTFLKEFKDIQTEINHIQKNISFEYEKLLNINENQQELKSDVKRLLSYFENIENDSKYIKQTVKENTVLLSDIDIILKKTLNTDKSLKKLAIENNKFELEDLIRSEDYIKSILRQCIQNRYKLDIISKFEKYKLGEKTIDYIDRIFELMKIDFSSRESILNVIYDYEKEFCPKD